VPYQMSALPIRGDRDQVVGGMLVGVKLERLFGEFADQSDDEIEMQIRPTLIDGVTILASAWPAERRTELARAMQPDKTVRVTAGRRYARRGQDEGQRLRLLQRRHLRGLQGRRRALGRPAGDHAQPRDPGRSGVEAAWLEIAARSRRR